MRPELFEENLIKEVQKYECLYHKDFISNWNGETETDTANAWSAIASTVGATDQQCQNRWKRLRERYIKIITKVCYDPEFKSIWKYSKAMSFLKDHLDIKTSTNTFKSIPEDSNKQYNNGDIFEEHLIEEVQKYECLYNNSHPDNRVTEKDKAWAAVSSAVNSTVQQCRHRWKSLKLVYIRSISRRNTDPEYTCHWKYMEAMSFLKEHLDLKAKNCPEVPECDFEEKLIQEVQKYVCIYNNVHPDHRRRSILAVIWSSIASAVGKTAQQCKARWKFLRARYIKEYLLMTSESSDKEYTSNWKYTDAMSFMKDYVAPKPSSLDRVCDISTKDMFCRACMRQVLNDSAEQSSKTYNIFQTLDLAEKLMDCTSLRITSDDVYPHSVCEKCYVTILDFYRFRKMCRDSLDKFMEMQTEQQQTGNDIDLEESLDLMEIENIENPSNITNTSSIYFDKLLETQAEIGSENYFDKILVEDPLDEHVNSDTDLVEEHEFPVRKNSDQEAVVHWDEIAEEKRAIIEKNQLADDADNVSQFKDSSEDEEEIPSDKSTSSIVQEKAKRSRKLKFKCEICCKFFYFQQRLEAHLRRHQGLFGYPCTHANCPRGFNRLIDLKHHLNDHNGIHNAYKCHKGNCDKVYTTLTDLRNHRREAHKKTSDELKFICEECGKVLTNHRSLKQHRLVHVDKCQWPHVCDEKDCSKRFRTQTMLRIHKRRHAGIKNYICPHCGVRRITRAELNVHINTHTLERTFVCYSCPKTFKSMAARSGHVRVYHKNGLFSCRFCERKFANAHSKLCHERIHTGERPYQCKECGKKFVQSSGLKVHMNMHLKGDQEKPHACVECGRRFIWPMSLKSHMKLHSEAKPYTCEECGKGIRWPGAFARHKKLHLKKKMATAALTTERVAEEEEKKEEVESPATEDIINTLSVDAERVERVLHDIV